MDTSSRKRCDRPCGRHRRGTAPDTSPASQPATQYWFGVAVENLPPNVARQLKLHPDQGLIVDAVMHDSPAERANIKPDDWLIKLNGQILTSQDDLAKAANAMDHGPSGLVPRESKLTYLRDGDEITVRLTPVPRPANMLVQGKGLAIFSASSRIASLPEHGLKTLNYALPNDGAAQVGPGYPLNLNGQDFTTKSIKEIFSSGKTLVLTQEMDAAGVAHNTITVGDKVYPVEPGQLDALPPDLRPIGKKLLETAGTPTTQPQDDSANSAAAAQQRLDKLEKENQELRRQRDEKDAELQKLKSSK